MVASPPLSVLAEALDSLPSALFVADAAGSVVHANGPARRLAGADPTGTDVTTLLPGVTLGDAGWVGPLSVPWGDGAPTTVSVRVAPLTGGGAVVVVQDPFASDRPSDRQLVELTQLVAEVAGATDLESAAEIVTTRATSTLYAQAAALTVLDGPGTLRLIRLRTADGGVVGPLRFSANEDNAVAEAVRSRRVVAAASRAETLRRWPQMAEGRDGSRSMAVFPLTVAERCTGALLLSFPSERSLSELDRQYLGALADCCAQTVDRISATAAAADAAGKLAFLADASEALAASLDYEATLRTVADLAVPRLADWCSIDLLEEGRLRRVAVSHADPARVELAWRLWEQYPPDMDAPTGAAAVVRSGETELVEEVDAALLDALELTPDLRQLVVDLQLNSGITAALRARGRTLGVMSFVFAESGRRYTPDDVRLAEDLARRAAIAIDNSQLHTETLQSALQLQRAILPATFADTDDWRVAVHYRPAGRTEVGGDFFDALSRPDGRIVALVGDVMGRGIAAAATMAQVRSAVRGFITEDPDPAAVIGRVDAMFVDLDLTQLVTLLYAVIDPAAGTLCIAHAGHLPPLVLRPGGVEWIDLPVSPPLGLSSDGRPVLTVDFGPDDTLVLYTDGLVERRGEDIADGMQRLHAGVAALRGALNDEVVARLADAMRLAGHDDDVTVVAVRQLAPATARPAGRAPADGRDPGPTRDAELLVGAEADAVPRARRFVRAALDGLGDDLVADAELVASELVTNAVLHGEAPIGLRLSARPDRVRLAVDDRGRDLPVPGRPRDDSMTGRGLALVGSVASRWGVDEREEGGKTVWAELEAGGQPDPWAGGPELRLARADHADAAHPGDAVYPVALGLVPTDVILAAEAHTDSIVRELTLIRAGADTGADLADEVAELTTATTSELLHALGQMQRQALAAAGRGEAFTDVLLALPPTAATAAERYLEAMEVVDRAARDARLLTLATPRPYRAFRRWFAEAVVAQLEALVAGTRPQPARPFALALLGELDRLAELEGAADRLDILQDLTGQLAGAHAADEMAELVVEAATRFSAVRSARVYLVERDGTARSVARRPDPGPGVDRYGWFSLDADLPGAEVLRSGEPFSLRSLTELSGGSRGVEGEGSLHLHPVNVEGRAIGLLALTFDAAKVAPGAQLAFGSALAHALAQGVARTRPATS